MHFLHIKKPSRDRQWKQKNYHGDDKCSQYWKGNEMKIISQQNRSGNQWGPQTAPGVMESEDCSGHQCPRFQLVGPLFLSCQDHRYAHHWKTSMWLWWQDYGGIQGSVTNLSVGELIESMRLTINAHHFCKRQILSRNHGITPWYVIFFSRRTTSYAWLWSTKLIQASLSRILDCCSKYSTHIKL